MGGPGPESESGQAQAASDPRPGYLPGKSPGARTWWGKLVPSLQPLWDLKGLHSASRPRHARTHMHMRVEAGGLTLGYCVRAYMHAPVCSPGVASRGRLRLGREGPEAAGRRWEGCPEQGSSRKTHMPLHHPGPACHSPRAGLWGGDRMEFGELAWGDGKSLAGTWQQVMSMRCLEARD